MSPELKIYFLLLATMSACTPGGSNKAAPRDQDDDGDGRSELLVGGSGCGSGGAA